MQITIDRLITDGLTLGRCLMVVSPSSIDLMAMVNDAFQRNLAANPAPEQAWWFRVQTKNNTGYIWANTKRMGRYRRDLPEGLDPRSVIQVTIEEANRPSIRLLDEFLSLLKDLAAGLRIKVLGEPGHLEFVSKPGDAERIEQLAQMLTLTKTACDEGHNLRITAALMRHLRDNLLSVVTARPSLSNLINLVTRIGQEGRTMRNANAADAQLASWFMVYEDLCRDFERYIREQRGNAGQKAALLTCYIAFGCAGGVVDPDALTPALGEKLAREGFHHIVEQRAEKYLNRGEGHIKQALNSRTMEEFGAFLYEAGLDLFAARRLYDALHVRPRKELSEEQLRLYKKSADVAEEKCVRVNNALFVRLQDRTGEKLEEHRLRVQKARDDGGVSAADDVVFELIEMSYCYPRYFEPMLLGHH